MPVFEEGIKVAIYIRSKDEISKETQLLLANDQVERSKFIIVETYIDEASCTEPKRRKELMRMLQDAEEGKFTAVLTMSADRLARCAIDSMQIREMLDKWSVSLAYFGPVPAQPFLDVKLMENATLYELKEITDTCRQ